jgi:hypothetical protein
VDSIGSGWGPVEGCCEYRDESSGSGATELVQLWKTVRCNVEQSKELAYFISFCRNAQEKKLVGTTRQRCENGIQIDFAETVYDGLDYTEVTLNTVKWRILVNTLMELLVPWKVTDDANSMKSQSVGL